MKCIIKHKSIRGKRNQERSNKNQDLVTFYKYASILSAIVSDGCTNCDYPNMATEINSRVVEAVAKEPSIWEIPEKKFKNLIRDEYIERFDASGYEKHQLAATTAFVIINEETDDYIAFSLGDTGIMIYREDLRTEVLLEPNNILTKSLTYFTNDDTAIRKFSCFRRGNMVEEKIAGFIIYSDGAEYVSNPNNNQVKELIRALYISDEEYMEKENEIFESMKKMTKDDISIAVIGAMNEKIKRNIVSSNSFPVTELKEPEKIAEIIDDEIDKTIEKIIPVKERTHVYSEKKEEFQKTSPIKKNESQLLRYMQESRNINEIADAGIIDDENVIETLTLLFKIGAITCYGNKFRTR